MSFDVILERLEERGLTAGPVGWDGNLPFRCPAHDDNSPSASIREGDDGKVLLHCHAGCDAADIMATLELPMSELFPEDPEPAVVATYTYQDERGNPLIQVERLEPGVDGKKKSFRQSRWTGDHWSAGLRDTRRVLYGLPEILMAGHVWIVEGEKDADRLNNEVFTSPFDHATTTIGGAGKRWDPAWSEDLIGKDITIIADNDEPGVKHANAVFEALVNGPPIGAVRILYPAAGKDVSDHLDAGLKLDELRTEPPAKPSRLKPINFDNIPPPRALLYEPFIYERALTWLWGPSGHGKSMVLDKAMADLSNRGVASLLYEWEEGYQEGERLRRLGANLSKIQVFNMSDSDEPVDLATEWLPDEIISSVKAAAARLVVINPFVLAGGSPSGNDPDVWNEAPRRARALFKRIIEETGAAVVVIDHQDDPEKERAHGGRSKKWLSDIYLRVTRDGDEYQPGRPYHLKIDNLKQAREWLPTIRATVIGQHKQGPLWIQWDYARENVGEEAREEVASSEQAPSGASPEPPAPAPRDTLPLAERLALRRLERELGATEVAE